MKENHSQNMNEEKLDRLARIVLQSAVLSDEEIEEIAAAPELWRATRNRLAEEKAAREKRWFFGWRWQWASVAAFAILIAAGAAFWNFRQTNAEIAADSGERINIVSTVALNEKPTAFETNSASSTTLDSSKIQPKNSSLEADNSKAETVAPKVRTPRFQFVSQPQRAALTASKLKSVRALAKKENVKPSIKPTTKTATESATEFIALSYLPASESGQVVRVKVPRSMMVSLGVTTKTDKSSDLVNAEVVLGDDGAARAIRFLSDE